MTQRYNLHSADLPFRADAFAATTSGQSATSGLSDSNGHASPHGRARKAMRLAVSLPVMIRDQFGGQFQARTHFVTVRGAVLQISSTLRVGHKLTIQNLRSGRSAECHVTAMDRAVKDSHEVEVEFTRPQPDFWPVQFPGEDSRSQETVSAGSPITNPVQPHASSSELPDFPRSTSAFSEPKAPRTVPHDDGIVVLADSVAENFSPSPGFHSHSTFAPPSRTAPVDSVAQFRAANRAAHRREQTRKTFYSILSIIALGGVVVAGRTWISHPGDIAARLSTVSVLPKATATAPASSESSGAAATPAPKSTILPAVTPAPRSTILPALKKLFPSIKKDVIEMPSTEPISSTASEAAQPAVIQTEVAKRPAGTQVAVRHGSSLASSRKLVKESQSDEEPMALPLQAGDGATSGPKPELLNEVVGQAPVKAAVLAPPVPTPALPAAQVPKQVTPARLIYSTPAQYPSIARQLRTEGEVVLDLEVDPSGSVSAAKAISGPPVLRAAALDAVKRWKFAPATLGGKPVSSNQTVKVDFRLK